MVVLSQIDNVEIVYTEGRKRPREHDDHSISS
jgi:hypothetical protein